MTAICCRCKKFQNCSSTRSVLLIENRFERKLIAELTFTKQIACDKYEGDYVVDEGLDKDNFLEE